MVSKKANFYTVNISMKVKNFAAQAERFASGRPTEQFTRVAMKEIKHKL